MINNIHPAHLSQFSNYKLHVNHYKSVHEWNLVLNHFINNVLNIEIFDLYKSMNYLNKEIRITFYSIINQLPIYI